MALKVDIWGGNVECMRTDSWISSGAASGKVNASPEGGEIENSFLLGISPPSDRRSKATFDSFYLI